MTAFRSPKNVLFHLRRRNMHLNNFRHEPIRWVSTFLFLAALSLLIGGCKDSHGRQQAEKASLPEAVTVTIVPQAVELTTELPGRTAAHRIAEIRPQINGLIQKRLFEEGSCVNTGQILYQIDPGPFRATLKSAQASFRKAQANVTAIKARAHRYKTLLAQNAVSQQDYDDAAASLDQAMAEIDYREAEIEKARINLKYTQVTAPIPGRIGRSRVTDGALVTAYQATPLTIIQQLNPIYVDVTQSTTELLRLRSSLEAGRVSSAQDNGKSVRIILEDGSAYSLEGKLQFRDVTSVDPATGSYTLRIVVPNPDHLLLPDMFVRAVITEGTIQQAILVPQEGVTRNPKGEAIAFVVDDSGIVRQRELTLDRAVGNTWLVTSGLSAGDRLIVEGRMNVKPGDAVTVVPLNAVPDSQNVPTQISNNNQMSS